MILLRWKAGNMLPKIGKKLHRETTVDAGGQIDAEIGWTDDREVMAELSRRAYYVLTSRNRPVQKII
jgi:hypothetical protein